jgi:hypothetical protein
MRALEAEFCLSQKLSPAIRAAESERSRALQAELRLGRILLLAPRAIHVFAREVAASTFPSSVTLTRGDREGERRPLPDLAFDPDPAPVQLDELPTES